MCGVRSGAANTHTRVLTYNSDMMILDTFVGGSFFGAVRRVGAGVRVCV